MKKGSWDSFLGPGGPLSAKPFYEYRKDQVELAGIFSEIIEGRGVVLAEAGTGTGKSLAYLLPAVESGQRVVVATRTKALQDQLSDKDVPLAAEILGRKVDFVKVKGKGNYLCLLYYDRFKRNPLFRDPSEIPFLAVLEEWSSRTVSGEKSELKGLPEDLDLWNQVGVKQERCIWSRCPFFEDCFLLKLKRRAENADLIITNHHVLFADASLRARAAYASVLPDFNNVVIDEAHEAEDSATTFFGVSVSKRMVEDWFGDCARELGPAREGGRKGGPQKEISAFFDLFPETEEKRRLSKDDYAIGRDELPAMLARMRTHHGSLEGRMDEDVWLGLGERAGSLADALTFILQGEERDFVKSVERKGGNLHLAASPIKVGELLRETLFERVKSAVLTSATLSVNGSFDFISGRLGLPRDSHTLRIESPFSFREQGLFYVPRSFPGPSDPGFQESACEAVKELVSISGGRAFVLCTSLKSMRAIHESLKGVTGHPLFLQGELPKGELLLRFREEGNAVLVATSSFWQGVDVQGEALSLVVLDKIPFASPGEPLIGARIEEIRSRGEDPFFTYQLPMAAMILKQGMGRLIRSRRDRGVVACLDVRLRSKGYGRTIIESLPPFPLTGSIDDVRAFFS